MIANTQQFSLNSFKTCVAHFLHYFSVRSGKSIGQYKLTALYYHRAFGNIRGFFPQNSLAILILTSSIFLRINCVLQVYHNRLIKLLHSVMNTVMNTFVLLDQKIPEKTSTKCDLCNKPYQTHPREHFTIKQ